jgi:TolB-like protein
MCYPPNEVLYRFGSCTLDTGRCELRCRDAIVPTEPQVYALLRLLIENRERVVSRDEILEQIWEGRVVSDDAVASRVKSARRAIGDDGRVQAQIRTVRKRGFRFVAEVEEVAPTKPAIAGSTGASQAPEVAPPTEVGSRPSIAVLPFDLVGAPCSHEAMADALPHDLIVELSRLRWLFVIARGSSFRFRGAEAVPERVGAALRVRYCLTGSVEIAAGALTVTVEVADTRDGHVVWSERFRAELGAVHEIRQTIVQAVTNALELEIPLGEARRARLKAPDSLDAWSAYHLGLRQMYRFSREGNALAGSLFERAIALDPDFARAYAGLSFTHFENAFLGFAADCDEAAERAQRCAQEGLERDPLDPFCNLVMGRVFWLRGDLEASLPWLDRAIELNPSYAQGRYSHAWASTLMGAGREGQAGVDAALDLSPLDPLAYGMLGVRAFTHMVLDEPGEAVRWAESAARSPGAHALIEMIAAVAHGLNGDEVRARAWAASARRRSPGLAPPDFLRAFPFRDSTTRRRIAAVLARLTS